MYIIIQYSHLFSICLHENNHNAVCIIKLDIFIRFYLIMTTILFSGPAKVSERAGWTDQICFYQVRFMHM